jgi:hypothetical protein
VTGSKQPGRDVSGMRDHGPKRSTRRDCLPKDELAAQRQRRREGRVTLSQIRRLLVADELRKRSKQGQLF